MALNTITLTLINIAAVLVTTLNNNQSIILKHASCKSENNAFTSTNIYNKTLYFRDSLIVCVADTLTCIFAGFVIFSFLGYMAGRLGVEVKDVAKDGKVLYICNTV